MKFFAKLLSAKKNNLVSVSARGQMINSMPGQVGALAANRFGSFV